MARMLTAKCFYCGDKIHIIEAARQEMTAWGVITVRTVNGHVEGTAKAAEASSWCGKCDKEHPTGLLSHLAGAARKL